MLEKITELRFERVTPQPVELPERGPVNLVLRGPKGLKGDPGDPEDITPASIGAATEAALAAEIAARTDADAALGASIAGKAPAADLAAEASARAAHAARTDNPHSVTAAQVGAATLAALAAEISARIAADAGKADLANTYTRAEVEALIAGEIANLIGTAPEILDDFGEVAAKFADNDDAFAAVMTAVAGKEAGGTAASLVAAHEAAGDPHPQYLLQSEGDTRADLRIAAAIGNTVQGFSANLAAWASQATTAFGRGLANLANADGLTAAINTFTTTLKGLVPAPGTVSGRYLRDDGWAAIPAGVTHVESSPITLTNTTDSNVVFAHGLGVRPKKFGIFLECVGAEAGYSVGDRIIPGLFRSITQALSISANATDVTLSWDGTMFTSTTLLVPKAGGTASLFVANPVNWRLIFWAEA